MMSASANTEPVATADEEGTAAGHAAGRRAAWNTGVRAAGEIIGKLGSLVLLAVLARKLGDDKLGVFVFGLAWAEVAMTPVGMGIDQFLIRRVAADRSRLQTDFWNAIWLKLARGVPVVIGSIGLVYALDYSSETALTVTVLTLGTLADTMARTPANVFQALERGELVATPIVAQRLIAALLGVGLLLAGSGVVAVAVAYSLGAAIRLVYSMALLGRHVGTPRRDGRASERKELRKSSFAFTAQDLFGLVLARADVLILGALATDAVVGQYGSAYRIFEATTFINVALAGAFTAMYTYLGPDTSPTLASVFQRSIKLALGLLLPIAVTMALLADSICRAFYGTEFSEAADSLRLLAPVVVLFGLMVLTSVLVLSRSHPRRMVFTVALASAVNLGLNVALVPGMGAKGAALAMLLSMVLYASVAMWLAALETGAVNWISVVAAPGLAALVMAAPLLLLPGPWPVVLMVSVAIYLALYSLIDHLVDPEDFAFVVGLVRRRLPGAERPRSAGRWSPVVMLARRVKRKRSLVLAYHGVGDSPMHTDPEFLQVAPAAFRRQVAALLDAGFEAVTVQELARRSEDGRVPAGLVAFTFDDGMEDNHSTLLPLLRERDVPATVYVTTGMIGMPNPWMVDSPARMMVEDELRDLAAAGWELGAHTVTHLDMEEADYETCLAEMTESRDRLAEIIGSPVTTFAYPYCKYGPAAHQASIDAGFEAAVTCHGRGSWEMLELKRTMITGKDGVASFALKLLGLYQPLFESAPGRSLRRITRALRRSVRGWAEDRGG